MKIISISGLATSGKNTLADIIKQKYDKNIVEMSFATQLRDELREFIWNNFEIDTYTDNSEQKSLIRPLLVEFAAIRRKTTQGQYFMDKLMEKITKARKNGVGNIVITDLRFKTYPYDEIDLCNNLGPTIHLKKYIRKKSLLKNIKLYFNPPNKTEEENDPRVEKLCKYKIEWPHVGLDRDERIDVLYPYCKKILDEIFDK